MDGNIFIISDSDLAEPVIIMVDLDNVCIGHVGAMQNSCYNCLPDDKNRDCPLFSSIAKYNLPDYLRMAYQNEAIEKMRLQGRPYKKEGR